ncbi:hypothetical protein PAMP_009541 [Pampus punctatissimus]
MVTGIERLWRSPDLSWILLRGAHHSQAERWVGLNPGDIRWRDALRCYYPCGESHHHPAARGARHASQGRLLERQPKLAKWGWGSGVAILFPSHCAFSCGSVLGLREGSLANTVAWTLPGTAAESLGSSSRHHRSGTNKGAVEL